MEINNIEDLRKHAIETINKLRMRSIELDEAAATSKLYENVISTLKSEIEYNKYMKIDKSIPFLHGKEGEYGLQSLNTKKLVDHIKIIEHNDN